LPDRHDVFALLVKPIRKIIEEKGFEAPTGPQAEAIPLILRGDNVLLIAPTGTGKTEAAFLPIFSNLIQSGMRPLGIQVLYITPLRSLNRDILERLRWWCAKLDIKVAVRHGDTSTRDRSLQSRIPPTMLITTPETLQAILPGRRLRGHLRAVRWVIVDEVHEFAEDKRGSQLSLALERLRLLAEQEFQLVGLSATIGSPEKVAKFLVGAARPVEVVRVPVARSMKFQIVNPEPTAEDDQLASRLYTHSTVAARLRVMRQLIETHRSVLLFTNTRSIAEVLASRFKVWDVDFPVSIHHGSLAKPSRITAERGLKEGVVKGLVCTSSMELGIDVGRIDLVIQYMSPRQVTRLVQRVGRSGHSIGRVAEGAIFTLDADDTLEAVVIARKAYKEDLEPVLIPDKPLDVLTHQIAGLFTFKRSWDFDQMLGIFRRAYPYRTLGEDDLLNVLSYMHDRYPRLAWISPEDRVAMKPRDTKELYQYYYENLSMIPDVKRYLIVDESNETPIGILDEAFVAEYGNPGTKFIVRGSSWRISSVYGDKIFVNAVDDPTGSIPSWVGEEIPVPFDVAQEVGEIRAFVEERLAQGDDVATLASTLAHKYPADEGTILNAIKDTVSQVQRGIHVPTDRRIVLEDWEGYTVLHANFGTLVNRTLGILLGHVLAEATGYTLGVQEDPYRIILQSGGMVTSRKVHECLSELSPLTVDSIVASSTAQTGLFKRRLIHVSRKFGAVSKDADFSSISLNQLSKSFKGTAIFDEAIKVTLTKDADLPRLKRIVEDLQTGDIEVYVHHAEDEPSPITRLGLERMHSHVRLITSEKRERLTLEAVKARLLNEVRTFTCTNCWGFVTMMPVKAVTQGLQCSKCGSTRIGVLSEPENVVRTLTEKVTTGKPTARERRRQRRAIKTGELVDHYGGAATIVLAAKGLRITEVEEILSAGSEVDDTLYRRVIDAERKALTRMFW
jgi:ATP-dependent Lhr-like helicase